LDLLGDRGTTHECLFMVAISGKNFVMTGLWRRMQRGFNYHQ